MSNLFGRLSAVFYCTILLSGFGLSQAARAQEQETPSDPPAPVNRPLMRQGRGMMRGMMGPGMGQGMQGPAPMQGNQGPGIAQPVPGPNRMPMMQRRMGMRRIGMRMMGRGPRDARIGNRGAAGSGARDLNMLRMLRRPDVQKEINLTTEQKKRLEDIGFNGAKAALQERTNLQIQRLELGRLMRADTPDRAAVDKKLQEIAQTQAALSRSMIHGRLDAQSVLTKEQRQKLEDGMQKLMQRRQTGTTPGAGTALPVKPVPAKPKPATAPKPPGEN